MNVGFHADETWRQIVERKLNEEEKCGMIFWGYSGTICHPLQRRAFVKQILHEGQIPKLVISLTTSKPISKFTEWAKEFSVDGKKWLPIPEEIYVKGSKYVIVCCNLKQVNE